MGSDIDAGKDFRMQLCTRTSNCSDTSGQFMSIVVEGDDVILRYSFNKQLFEYYRNAEQISNNDCKYLITNEDTTYMRTIAYTFLNVSGYCTQNYSFIIRTLKNSYLSEMNHTTNYFLNVSKQSLIPSSPLANSRVSIRWITIGTLIAILLIFIFGCVFKEKKHRSLKVGFLIERVQCMKFNY